MEAVVEQTTIVAVGGADDDGGGPKDITNIAKGKRTKRQRPQSPILFTFSSTNNNDDHLTYSLTSSSGFPAGSITTEDEDTARSLILLSKGQSLDLSAKKNKDDNYEGMFKFNSKKYIQTPTTGNAGVFVYECKTCSRTFPSFQALGGHRASHKKPKNNEDMRKPPPYMVVNEPPPPQEFPLRNNNFSYSSSLSLQMNNRVSLIGNATKPSSKLHECSICGTEFNSGQALGGHMRRHRVAGGGNKGRNSNTATLSLIPFNPVTTTEVYDDQKSKNDDGLCNLGLGLDLNLPAPREATTAVTDYDQGKRRSFTFSPTRENEKKPQPDVHLSATPTLVDCHY